MNRFPLILTAAALMAAPAFAQNVVATLDHNGSTMAIERLGGNAVQIVYARPRSGLEKAGVTPGTVLFTGDLIEGHFRGKAHTFKHGCKPVAYSVEGQIDPQGSIALAGPGPVRGSGCSLYKFDWSSPHSNLAFTGNPVELAALIPPVLPPTAAEIVQVMVPQPVPAPVAPAAIEQLPAIAPTVVVTPTPAPVAPMTTPAAIPQPVPVVVADPVSSPAPASSQVVTTPAVVEETVAETVAPPPPPVKKPLNLNIDF